MFLLSVDELDVDNINGKPEIRTVNKQVADCHALTACIAVRFCDVLTLLLTMTTSVLAPIAAVWCYLWK